MVDLAVLLEGRVAAEIRQDSGGEYVLRYSEEWRDAEDGYPISLSMPLAQARHPDGAVRPFLAGLLPDNERILEQWGRRFGVSPRNPLALLQHMGEDCAGAVQIVPDAEVSRVLESPGDVQWLTDKEVADEIRRLREGVAPSKSPAGHGSFSLAGAQAKTALLKEGDRWGRPMGRVPTTHILKPPVPHFPNFVENEHLSMRLAEAVGLAVARSTVIHFEDQPVIAVERFDRRTRGDEWVRIHHEDFCQALAIPPALKYEADGGPGASDLVKLLEENASRPGEAVQGIVDAVIFNLLIGGTDGHGKNFALLLGPLGLVDLAPLYDLASSVPYPREIPFQEMRLAMQVGGEYSVWKLRRKHLERLAEDVGYPEKRMVALASEMAEDLHSALPEVERGVIDEGLDPGFVRLWTEAVRVHSSRIRTQIG